MLKEEHEEWNFIDEDIPVAATHEDLGFCQAVCEQDQEINFDDSDRNEWVEENPPTNTEMRQALNILKRGARRKGVDGFSVETPGLLTDPVPISPSSDSLTDAWAPNVHKLCYNQAFCGLCDALMLIDSSTAISTCVDPTVLPYELIHSRNRGIVGHNVSLPRAWQVLVV
ncbi:hypothetical protein AVEN_139516-1 [Araneus ventricosus]|uniref:Uncharacterized protein n=1 Tax=Araneus ventricosus TaxID=182803 RepID=A0A4Y2WSM3_ARAVE|nr:hypothetical protein AVEN_139516-1 [Araneus ventricosus]